MIVQLVVTPPDGESRRYEFRRPRIRVGAGSANEIVLASSDVAVDALTLEVRGQQLWIADVDASAAITVVETTGAAATSAIAGRTLAVDSRLFVGSPPIEIRVAGLRRAEHLDVSDISAHGWCLADEPVDTLTEELGREALRFAYRTAFIDEPREFVAALEEFLRPAAMGRLSGVQLGLPNGDGKEWETVASFGTDSPALPWASLGVELGPAHDSLCGNRALACVGGGEMALLVPVCSGSALECVVALRSTEPSDELWKDLEVPLLSVRPMIAGFASRASQRSQAAVIADENRYYRERERRHYPYKDLVTESEAMGRVHRALRELAMISAPVLITGEAGTGKELLARGLHHLGGRANGVMVAQHCGELDEQALDVELFGRAPSLPNDFEAPRRGLFELADGGTVFLDEIHALSSHLQTRLMRALTEGEVFRIGDTMARSVDVRVVAATHLDLMQLADEGRFRRDLAIALTRHVLLVPPLRERREDIAPLAAAFVRQFARRYRRPVESVESDTLAWLEGLSWPGNVRELLTSIERAVLQSAPDQRALRRSDFELR